MTQQDIRNHYETQWKTTSSSAGDTSGLSYSDAIEDAVLYPAYERLLNDLHATVTDGRVLDVGSGSGRWIRFFLDRWKPALLTGIDFASESIELLRTWHGTGDTPVEFRHADITSTELDLGGTFDLINVANVLFHIPEPDLFAQALANLASLVDPQGFIVTTEYMPRVTRRTEWMMVRDRYAFEAACAAAGLRIAMIRGFSFFANDPMGIDGPDDGTRLGFCKVRAAVSNLFSLPLNDQTRKFLVELFCDVERAAVSYARERVADVDLPGQKLVVLTKA